MECIELNWLCKHIENVSSSRSCTELSKTQLSPVSILADTDVLKKSRRLTTKQDVVTTSGKRRRLEDVQFTTSWKRLIYDVFRTSDLQRPEDVWFMSSWRRTICDVLKTSDLQRLIYDVLKTSNLRYLEDVQFTTSWRRVIYDVLKTCVKRHLRSNVVATSIQRRKKLLFPILYCLKYSENFKCSRLS